MQLPTPSDELHALIWVIMSLMGFLSLVITLLFWIHKTELGRIRDRIHELGNHIGEVVLKSLQTTADAMKTIADIVKEMQKK